MKECVSCGSLFTPRVGGGKPQKHCSHKCLDRVQHATRRRERRLSTQRLKCAECDQLIVHSNIGRPRKFCSDACKRRATTRKRNRSLLSIRQTDVRACQECGQQFQASRRDNVFCSPRCAKRAAYLRVKMGQGGKGQLHQCPTCGGAFTASTNKHRFCSERCRNRHFGLLRSRSVGKPSTATYTDREIFERDGWRCHLCKKPVRQDVPRTHDEGATIDHLIPRSLGGEDEPANVATAHWKCNRDKGARAVGEQLALL